MEKIGMEIMITAWVIIFGLIGYLFLQQGKQSTRLAVVEKDSSKVVTDVEQLTDKMEEKFEGVTDQITKVEENLTKNSNRLETRLDMFISNEIELLKKLAGNGTK